MQLATVAMSIVHSLFRRIEDFELHKRLYQGKASLLYCATCKNSKLPVAVKVYRKARLSELNWYQVSNRAIVPTTMFCMYATPEASF